jgi:subtilisin family serine protease
MKQITSLTFLLACSISVLFPQTSPTFYHGLNRQIPIISSQGQLTVNFSATSTPASNIAALAGLNGVSLDEVLSERVYIVSSSDITQAASDIASLIDVHTLAPVYFSAGGQRMPATDEFVVRFKETTLQQQIDDINLAHGVSVIATTPISHLLSVPVGSNSVWISNQYYESGLVKYAQPNFLLKVEPTAYIPNDFYFPLQYGFHNTGQLQWDGHTGTPDADIDAPEAWEITKGDSEIIIAVTDDGVTDDHYDLPSSRQIRLPGSNIAGPFDNTDPNDPSPTDDDSHGNACAGLIAAEQDK